MTPRTDRVKRKRSDAEPPADRRLTDVEKRYHGEATRVYAPDSYRDLEDLLSSGALSGRTVVPAGGGQHAYLGNIAAGDVAVVSLANLRGVLRYEPGDFTIGVQAGLRIDELAAVLGENGQELPIDLSSRRGSTIGGAVAANRNGPRRHRHGMIRNLCIGMSGLRGDGARFQAGGMVVKNVAGYDITKLFVGSLGTLGFLLETNFKLRQKPSCRQFGCATFSGAADAFAFARQLVHVTHEPSVVEVLDSVALRGLAAIVDVQDDAIAGPDAVDSGDGGRGVAWLLEGNRGAVDGAVKEIDALLASGEVASRWSVDTDATDAGLEFLSSLEEPDDPLRDDLVVVRIASLPSHIDTLARDIDRLAGAGNAVSEGCSFAPASGIAVARYRAEPDALDGFVTKLRELCERANLHGRILFASPSLRRQQAFSLREDANRSLAERVQRVFDPTGIFHRHRI